MSEIPEDIMEAARSVRVDYVGEATGALRPWPRLDELIALSILAERERCAKVAEAYPYHSPFYANTPSLDAKIRSGQSVASGEIATAIRNQKT